MRRFLSRRSVPLGVASSAVGSALVDVDALCGGRARAGPEGAAWVAAPVAGDMDGGVGLVKVETFVSSRFRFVS